MTIATNNTPGTPPGSVTNRTDPNCGTNGGYMSGTEIVLVTSPSQQFVQWTGTCPGVNGNTSAFITFVITFSCSAQANFQ